MAIYAPVVPLSFDKNTGYEMYDNLKSVVVFHMKNLLLTSPGERIHDPNYGVGIKRFLFEQLHPGTISRIESAIINKINKYLPYVNLESVSVVPDTQSDHKITVQIKFEIPATQQRDELTMDFVMNSVSIETTDSWLTKIF